MMGLTAAQNTVHEDVRVFEGDYAGMGSSWLRYLSANGSRSFMLQVFHAS